MFFYISKTLWFLAQPSSALLVLLLLGVFLLWTHWAWAGRRLVALAGILLLLLSLSPLGQALTWPLEDRFPATNLDQGQPPDGVIILGGALSTHVGLARNVASLNESAERMTEAIILAHRFPEARIVFSGGGTRIIYEGRKEAIGAEELLTAMGLARERLELEDRALNTYQNARFTKELVKPQPDERWILVTSAFHMPRAIGSFRQVGFAGVEPWPVDYRTRGPQDWLRFFDKPSEGLRRIDFIAHEWLGLLVYWLTGRTPNLFPAPAN